MTSNRHWLRLNLGYFREQIQILPSNLMRLKHNKQANVKIWVMVQLLFFPVCSGQCLSKVAQGSSSGELVTCWWAAKGHGRPTDELKWSLMSLNAGSVWGCIAAAQSGWPLPTCRPGPGSSQIHHRLSRRLCHTYLGPRWHQGAWQEEGKQRQWEALGSVLLGLCYLLCYSVTPPQAVWQTMSTFYGKTVPQWNVDGPFGLC